MSEIEKMYENAGIKPDINYVCDKDPCEKHSVNCQECSHIYDTREDYPDFTAEKQIELIKWFIHSEHFSPVRFNVQWVVDDIASYINFLWQILTEEEKQQVKGILE